MKESDVLSSVILIFVFKEVEQTLFGIYCLGRISPSVSEMLHKLLICMIYLYNTNWHKTVKTWPQRKSENAVF